MVHVFGDFELDEELFELRRAGERVALRPQALDVLLQLVTLRDRVVTKEDLSRAVWSGATVSDTALPQAILAVRRALSDDDQSIVQTVRGRGYRFMEPVTTMARQVAAVPALAPPTSALDFVGRTALLEKAAELSTRAAAGQGGVLLIAGGVGSGKSRAALEIGEAARAAGALVAMGRCYSDEGVPDLWPWVQVLRGAGLETVLGDGADGSSAQFRLFDSIARALVDRAKAQPLVIILDDVHWADAGSLLLLKLVAQAFRTTRALVIATYRDAALATNHVLARSLGAFAREEPARCTTLEPLAAADVATLTRLALGRDLASDAVARMHEKTAGNPLFLTQLLHAMRVEERLSTLPAGSTSAMLAVDTMREAVALHLGELSEPCREVLAAAAVFGASFELALVATILGRDANGLLPLLDEALAARIVARSGDSELRFVHVLVRDVLYKKLTIAQRVKLHESARDALAARGRDEAARVHAERAAALLGKT